ncbi:MAG: undecaprenyl-phosphate glucose phosphotransferase [Spirochaetales bacterium]|nr:undecaprenyl-phosphate glucose phosphotransferase [Spirochaetales bacterium]
MFKKQARTLALIQRFVDFAAVCLAWIASFSIRFALLGTTLGNQLPAFLITGTFLAFLVLIFNTRNHLYESNRYFPWHRETLFILKSQFQALMTFVILLYFFWPMRLSRGTILIFIGLGLLATLLFRLVIRGILNRARSKGRNLRHVLAVGDGKALGEYVQALHADPSKGIRFIGWMDSGGLAQQYGITEITHASIKEGVIPDAVILGYQAHQHKELEMALEHFNKHFAQTLVVPDIENAFIGYTIEDFHGLPMISVNSSRLTMFQAVIKRLVDISGALCALILLSPLYLLLSIMVKATSKGPIFYGQERMTQDGKTFTMWKFRSMRIDAETDGAQWASQNDNRRTSIGTFLRRTSLDEIPQFWNVLIGEMSLVGPRPERPVFIDQFKEEIPSYMLRHRMKAGITGWAQVNGWRGDTSLEKRIECDIFYIRNWSLLLDVKILLLTVVKGFVNENAY